MSSSELNQSTAPGEFFRALLEAWNDHDPERVAAFYAPDYQGVDVGEARPHHGPQGARQMLARYHQAFPDLKFEIDEVMAEGNRVVQVYTAHGTHQGSWMHIPATGRYVTVKGVAIITIEKDKITQGFYIWDVAGLLRELGLLPEL